MYQFLQFCQFLYKSSNEHGVHSPFVFTYVTKCLYSKSKLHNDKGVNALLKSLEYFSIKTVSIIEEGQQFKETFEGNTDIKTTAKNASFLIIDHPKNLPLDSISYKNDLTNGTMMYIHSPYTNKAKKESWEIVKNDSRVTVTVDMFYGAMVFFRKEQVKEHFKIRI
ncbi:hypothetical protein [Euzebyella saccharophila]|uniref:Uncharacterized protein n=1 Tax=Euzebyella saccharophila TaxID=679664 RepID=A0ABV8JMG2_9FLAO|nr:hypothetical protein [Euzebyella saccharophila]